MKNGEDRIHIQITDQIVRYGFSEKRAAEIRLKIKNANADTVENFEIWSFLPSI